MPTNRRDDIDGDWAFFVQDRWTVGRLTVNVGLRMDWLMTSYPDQLLPGNLWVARGLVRREPRLLRRGRAELEGPLAAARLCLRFVRQRQDSDQGRLLAIRRR